MGMPKPYAIFCLIAFRWWMWWQSQSPIRKHFAASLPAFLAIFLSPALLFLTFLAVPLPFCLYLRFPSACAVSIVNRAMTVANKRPCLNHSQGWEISGLSGRATLSKKGQWMSSMGARLQPHPPTVFDCSPLPAAMQCLGTEDNTLDLGSFVHGKSLLLE